MNKSALQPIEQQVKTYLRQYFSSSDPYLVLGVSGGPDSMALMHIYKRLKVNLFIVHINYEKRDKQSDLDQQLVEETAESWSLNYDSMKVGNQLSKSSNFQDEARKIRFHCLEKVRKQQKADAISFAHHQEDQVETILHKLLRGAGMESWSGMKIWNEQVFRPLLETPKSRINSYVNSWDIPYRVDESNLETVYARNFLRNEWIPSMDRWFPGWRTNILKLTESSDQYCEVLDALISQTEKEPRKLFRAQVIGWDLAVRKAAILRWIKHYDPDVSISKHSLEELAKLDELQTGGYLQLTDKVEIHRDRAFFILRTADQEDDKKKYSSISRENIKISPERYSDWFFLVCDFQNPDFNSSLYLDDSKLDWPLNLRSWKAGDRIQPLGMKGTQKIKDHLTNRRVSAVRKSEAMVLEDQLENIVAVLFPLNNGKRHGTIAEFVKCDNNTKKALRITPVAYENV